MPYGITQWYLPPGRGDIPAFTPDGCKAELNAGEFAAVGPEGDIDRLLHGAHQQMRAVLCIQPRDAAERKTCKLCICIRETDRNQGLSV